MKHTISIIIPALNEASTINRTIESIFSLPYSAAFEVIVVDGSPGCETTSAIKRDDVKKVFSKKGRAYQMNRGALSARGEILLFLHADTELPDNSLNTISLVLTEGHYVGGAFDLGIKSNRVAFRLIEMGASLRSRVTRIPYGDQGIFIRREYFDAVGGFKELPLMEDVELMRRIRKAGDKIYISSDKVQTSPRRWEKEGVVYCTLRNWTLISLYFMGIAPGKLVKFYKTG